MVFVQGFARSAPPVTGHLLRVRAVNNTTASNLSFPCNSHVEAFIAAALQTEEIIGRKQAEERKCPTTGEAIMAVLAGQEVLDIMIPKIIAEQMFDLVNFFRRIDARNEFEQNVVRHTLESVRMGRVEPRSAAFVAWAGKIYKDRMAAEFAAAEAKNTPLGKAAFTAIYTGVRRVNTSFGMKAVHTFATTCGKRLEWWTDLSSTDVDDETGNLINVPYHEVNLNCRIKGSSVWQNRLTYKITHAKWVATAAPVAAPAAPKAAPAAPVALAPKAPEATTALPF